MNLSDIIYYLNRHSIHHATGWLSAFVHLEFIHIPVERSVKVVFTRRLDLDSRSEQNIFIIKAIDLETAVGVFGRRINRNLELKAVSSEN